MAKAAWKLAGEYMESCNCDYLCPCIYTRMQAPVTHDHCTVAMIYRIDKGRVGKTKLDALKFALVFQSGKRMADGNWVFGAIVDSSASAVQREALAPIVTGEAGGTPAFMREHLVGEFRGIEFKPIQFRAQGFKRSTRIGNLVSFAIEAVTPSRKSAEPYYLDNTLHPANPRLALARTKESHIHAFGLDVDMVGKGNNGHYAPFAWAG